MQIVRKADVASLRRLEKMQIDLLTYLRRAASSDLFLLVRLSIPLRLPRSNTHSTSRPH
jgi:hypothetical protein